MAGDKEIPQYWRYPSIGELEGEGIISEIQDGNHGERHPKSTDYLPSGIPFIMAKDLEGGRFNLNNCSFISKELADSLRIGFAKPGDVLLTHKATMGRVAIVPDGFEYVMLTPQVTYYRIGDANRLSNAYLKYAFLGPDFQHQLNSDSDQSTRKYIGITAQRRLRIPLPPAAEQRAIAHILGTLDHKIEVNRRMNETLEAMARALFKSWFIDFDPVRAKAEGRDTDLPQPIADLFPDSFENSELGEIPNGWEVTSLGVAAYVIDCLHSKKPERLETGMPLLQLANIRDDGLIDMDDTYFINEVEYRKWVTRMEASGGDCVITNVGRVGAVAQMPLSQKAALGRNMTGVRCKPAFPFPTVLIECLLSQAMRDEIVLKMDSGTILDALNVRNIPRLRFVRPRTGEILEYFEHKVRPLRAKMETGLAESRTLAALRDALLPKLISGELKVQDAERFIQMAAQ